MTATVAGRIGPASRDRALGTELAITRRALRQLRLGCLLVTLAFGGSAYATAVAYARTYPTTAAREQAAALVGSDAGLRILLGPINDITTVGGYVVYKNFVFLTTIGAIWALLAGTRLLRGEEDAGRWQLVLAGGTRPGRATGATLAALGAAAGVVFAGTTALTLLAARQPGMDMDASGTVLYGASLALVPAVFGAVGALASQLGSSRRTATALSLGVFGLALAVRMAADSGPVTHWLLWLTPFGWTELIRPYTANDAWPLLPAAAAVVALSATAIGLAARRDLGSGVLASRDVTPPRPFGLGSTLGLSARLELPVLLAWCAGAAAWGLLMGVFTRITTGSVPASFQDTLGKYGVHGSFLNEFLGVVFLMIGTVTALLPAAQVSAAAAEETSGRLVHVLTGTAGRTRWLAGRLLLAAGATVAAALLGGFGTWLGALAQGVRLDVWTLLGAGLNVVPTALVTLGVGAVMLSIAPRAAGPTVYAVVTWSALVDVVAPLVTGSQQLQRFSLFHYMALVPGDTADPVTVTAVTVIGLALCATATLLLRRRDVRI